jgi:hypothetical protein
MSGFSIVDGHYTGLLVPEVRESGFPTYASSQRVLSRQEIADIINDPRRVSARQRFPASEWIRNQGSRGSCNGYSCAKALERSRVLQGMPHVPLSGEGAYAQMNGGRDNGSTLANGMKVLLESGVPPESMVPHQEYLWSRISSEAKAARARFRAAECYAVDEEIELASGLALGFVGVIAVHASSNYSRLDANGVSAESNGPGNHSVGADDLRIVGNEFQFDSFNSWGIRWGHQGRNWVTWRRHLQQTIRYHQFFLIRAAGDDPQGTNPPAVKG